MTVPLADPLLATPCSRDDGGQARGRAGQGDAAARRSLRAQLTRLEGRLATLPAGLVREQEAVGAGPRLLSLGDLEAARDDLLARVGARARAADRQASRQAAARARVEAMLADPAAHRWERVTRAELGEPGCGAWESRPRLGLLGMLAGWWEVRLSGGCPLCGPRAWLTAG